MPSGARASFVEIAVESHPEAVEAVSEILDRVGYNGIAVEIPLEEDRPHVVKAWIPYDHAARIKVRRVKEAVEQLFGVDVTGVWTSSQRGKAKRVGRSVGRRNHWKKAIVALARKLLIALWRFVEFGELPEGAVRTPRVRLV